jgi:hypothetical protein
MPKLFKSISGKICDQYTTVIDTFGAVEGAFGYKIWFLVGSYEVFKQNWNNTQYEINLNKNKDLGLGYNKLKTFKEIEISY